MIRAVLVATILLASPAATQTASPTLGGIVRTGAIRLAVADDAPPFSWVGLDGQPIGYGVELCRRVAADVAGTLGWTLVDAGTPRRARTAGLYLVSVPVAEEAEAVADGTVDLGCSTLADPGADTGAGLAASPPVGVSGTRLMVARLGDVSSLHDLRGRTVAVVAGTRGAAALRLAASALSPAVQVRTVPGPGDGYQLLATGAVDALAGEDLVLAGLLATRTDGPSFEIVGRPLDEVRLALSFRAGDPAFASAVRHSLSRMAADGTLRRSYDRWFTTELPAAAAVDRPRPRDWDAVVAAPAPP